MTRIKIETEVELDLPMMAKAFAHMGSNEQAEFFALVQREMSTWKTFERDNQLYNIAQEITKEPDAKQFMEDLDEYLWPCEDEVVEPVSLSPEEQGLCAFDYVVGYKIPNETMRTPVVSEECDECFGTGLSGGFQGPCSHGCEVKS